MGSSRLDKSGKPTPEAVADEKELQGLFPGYRGVDNDYVHAGSEALERWWDWKFGIRIHWSVYSIPGNGRESWTLGTEEGGNPEFRTQYEGLYKWWNPSLFDAEQWTDMMVRSGLKFFTFTTKHHDGFSMYDTQTKVKKRRVHTGPSAGNIIDCDLHYSIMETPFRRDIVRELVDAGRKHDLGIGLYFSHIDWFDCDFRVDEWHYDLDVDYTPQSDPECFKRMIARHRQQIREICSNYGKLDLLSFDMWFPDEKLGIRDEIVNTVKMARRLQPGMLMRRRGIGPYGDYKTPERVVPDNPGAPGAGQDMPWQVIYPGSKHFSHNWHDEYKPASWIIENLVDITAKGGNFQVGYGPMPSGEWAPGVVSRLTEVGDWLKVNGEAIYATRPCNPFKEGNDIRFTRAKDGKIVYAILLTWPEVPFSGGKVKLKSVRARQGSAVRMLGLDHRFEYIQDENALTIDIPDWFAYSAKRPCKYAWAFRIEAET